MNIRGITFIADDLRDLTMYDWKILQHCWRSQTLATKAKWRQSQQRQLQLWKERALFHHHSHTASHGINFSRNHLLLLLLKTVIVLI